MSEFIIMVRVVLVGVSIILWIFGLIVFLFFLLLFGRWLDINRFSFTAEQYLSRSALIRSTYMKGKKVFKAIKSKQ